MDTAKEQQHVTAAQVMSTPVLTVEQSRSLWEAWTLMSSCGVRHLVVTAGGHCVGVLDDRRLVATWPQGPDLMQRTSVRAMLDPGTACVLPDATLADVADIMNTNGVDAVPVIDEIGKVLGLVTAVDVIRAVARWGIDAPEGTWAVQPPS